MSSEEKSGITSIFFDIVFYAILSYLCFINMTDENSIYYFIFGGSILKLLYSLYLLFRFIKTYYNGKIID